MSKRFDILFVPQAAKEYKKLDGSVKPFVNLALRKLEERADELGEELGNKRELQLHGCKKIKLRKHGIRIVYRIIGDQMEIVQILTIGKRDDNEVYRLAHQRLQDLNERLSDE